MRQYIMDHVKEQTEAGKPYPFDDGKKNVDSFYPAGWLSKLVKQAIDEIIISARQGMDWIQEASRIYANEGLPMVWPTPRDFICHQTYPKLEKMRARTWLDGTIYYYMDSSEKDEINTRRVAQGASPNFIHSLDAAHMMLTTLKCNTLGINDFQMIHDSYGCHSHFQPIMMKTLREEFHRIYQTAHLGLLKEQLESYGPALPAPTALGKLDPDAVLKSQFFFC